MPIFVNEVEISDSEICEEMQHHPAPTRERAWYLAAQSLVIRQLLLQQAVDSGLLAGPEASSKGQQEEAAIDRLLQQDLVVPEADEVTCQRFYDSNPDSFMDKGSGKRQPFTLAHSHIRDYLHTKAMRIAVAEYIRALSCKANVKGFEL
jgi:hypothetical protein